MNESYLFCGPNANFLTIFLYYCNLILGHGMYLKFAVFSRLFTYCSHHKPQKCLVLNNSKRLNIFKPFQKSDADQGCQNYTQTTDIKDIIQHYIYNLISILFETSLREYYEKQNNNLGVKNHTIFLQFKT